MAKVKVTRKKKPTVKVKKKTVKASPKKKYKARNIRKVA